MRNEIIEVIINEKWIDKIIKNYKIHELYREDYIQEMYLIILTIEEDRLIALYNSNDLYRFLIKICANNYRSRTSKFYYTHLKYIRHKIDDERIEKI